MPPVSFPVPPAEFPILRLQAVVFFQDARETRLTHKENTEGIVKKITLSGVLQSNFKPGQKRGPGLPGAGQARGSDVRVRRVGKGQTLGSAWLRTPG